MGKGGTFWPLPCCANKSTDLFLADNSQGDGAVDVTCYAEQEWVNMEARVALAAGTPRDAEAWMNCIRQGDWEALTALLLTYLPNIKDLTFAQWVC